MKKKSMKIVLALVIVFSVGSLGQKAYAKTSYKWLKISSYSPRAYHAKQSGQKAYIWNWNHTKVLHNMKNYPRTTWYAKSSITVQHGKKKAIYYQVISGNKKSVGYVWQGYLIKGKCKISGGRNTTTGGQSVNNGSDTYLIDPYHPSNKMSTKYINAELNSETVKMFPGTKNTKAAQNAANLFYLAYTSPNGGDYEQGYLDYYLGEKLGEKTVIFSTLGSPKYTGTSKKLLPYINKNLREQLQKNGHTFNDFSGYQIGVYVFPKNTKQYGNTMVYLVPKE